MSPVPSRPSAPSEKSLSRLLLELLWQLSALLIPIFLVTVLPPPLALAVVLGSAAGMVLAARLGWPRTGRAMARLMISAVFGLGFSLGRALPAYWDIAAAFASILVGMGTISHLERRLGLVQAPAASTSAWGGSEPQSTPEGLPIRVFNQGEIAMGGPTYCDYLFPDGVLLQGLGSSARFSSDGRYFAAPLPSRQRWGLAILDRSLRRLYRCDHSEFWELDAFSEERLSGRHSPLVDNGSRHASLTTLLEGAEAIDLLAVADLWLEPGAWVDSLARQSFEEQSPDGRHRLQARMLLPRCLRDLPQPLEPLRAPPYQLSLDGQPTGLLIGADSPRCWSRDSRSLACSAREEQQPDLAATWLWQADHGWRPLPAPWVASPADPSFYPGPLLELDSHYLRHAAYLDCAEADRGRYGYRLHNIHSDTETGVGHDPEGCLQVAPLPLVRTRVRQPLDSGGQRGDSQIESEPLLDGQRALFSWLADDEHGLGAYACRIGDWQLPGRWRLDHRVSDCRRYLALLPVARLPLVSDRAVVADLQQRRLLHSPPLLAARLLDLRHGQLSLAVIVGRLDQDLPSSPLQRFNQPAPAPDDAAAFCAEQDGSQLCYQRQRLQITEQQLLPLADWRLVDRPQAAVAEGDFIQPAPDGRDAAWLFGSETEYADSWLREGSPRLGGHLLTASGCALTDLAPSLIWSADGRYLALTRLRLDVEDGHRAWQLLLLDVHQRSLRIAPQWLRHRPLLRHFDHQDLELRLFERDWQAADDADPGRSLRLPLAELLALPAQALEPHQGLWLLAADAHLAGAWQALARPEHPAFGPAA
ncbi:sulfite exporter TauE/SafE family protein [Pseudomonas protegens]|uniref:sulfite exporter TauE/SafE family protein n=1 Tax=Pseudomonas protegens TaxID=380021 RepID=UPI003DA3DC43